MFTSFVINKVYVLGLLYFKLFLIKTLLSFGAFVLCWEARHQNHMLAIDLRHNLTDLLKTVLKENC